MFAQTSEIFAKNVYVIEQIGTGLVEAIETGSLEDPKLFRLLSSYINPMLEKQIDVLVLGCTHYPLLYPILNNIIPKNIQIIDSAEAVAKQTLRVLEKNKLLTHLNQEAKTQYFSSAENSSLNRFISKSESVLLFTSDLV